MVGYNQDMKIAGFIWLREVVEKLEVKHGVLPVEVIEVFDNQPKIRFMQRGNQSGEDVYIALGQTDAGRYLSVLYIAKTNHKALILSARDMARKERKLYAKK